jgi:hypothetical protein
MCFQLLARRERTTAGLLANGAWLNDLLRDRLTRVPVLSGTLPVQDCLSAPSLFLRFVMVPSGNHFSPERVLGLSFAHQPVP